MKGTRRKIITFFVFPRSKKIEEKLKKNVFPS